MNWIVTASGRCVNPLALTPEDIDIGDIAHALAQVNRFAGHACVPLSVAQHSYYVSKLCQDTPSARQALLHDGAEAYLGDIAKCVKSADEYAGYRAAEQAAQRLIYRAFGCPEEMAPEVKAADDLMARLEALEGFGAQWAPGPGGCTAMTPEERRMFPFYWAPMDWKTARQVFLEQFERVS